MDTKPGTKEGGDKGRIDAEDAISRVINNKKSQPQDKVKAEEENAGKLEVIIR